MVQLNKRSDGFSETPDGDFAIIMLRGSKAQDNTNAFIFYPDFTSDAIEVRWTGDVAFFQPDLSRSLVSNGYARNLSDDEAELISSQNSGIEETATGKRGRPKKKTPDSPEVTDKDHDNENNL